VRPKVEIDPERVKQVTESLKRRRETTQDVVTNLLLKINLLKTQV